MAGGRSLAGARLSPVVVAAMLLAGCGAGEQARDFAEVTANSCSNVACAGSIGGAEYEIVMPEKWNGTLLIYSHGYRSPSEPGPGRPEAAPGWSTDQREVGDSLLSRGYALAGSAYRSNGWVVDDGVAAAKELYSYFAAKVAKPQRVYAWGDSLGGLITAELAQQKPPWLSGAAPLCGVLAGVVPNMDLALDVAYAVKTLIYPGLRLTGFASLAQAQEQYELATAAVSQAYVSGGAGKVAYIGSIADAPKQSQSEDGADTDSQLLVYNETIFAILSLATVGRYEMERRFGGNISGNIGTDYSARVSTEDDGLIRQLDPDGLLVYDIALAQGTRVAPNARARTRAQVLGGNPTGNTSVPMITLHTAADPLVTVANESFFLNRYSLAARAGGLLQLYTVAPKVYPESPGTPYGAGHCNFTPQSRIGTIDLLDSWVQSGRQPQVSEITQTLGTDSGYDAGYEPPPWPEQQAR